MSITIANTARSYGTLASAHILTAYIPHRSSKSEKCVMRLRSFAVLRYSNHSDRAFPTDRPVGAAQCNLMPQGKARRWKS
jgi:hypothetical protein